MGRLHTAESKQSWRILIADDTAGARALLREILEAAGHSVAEADDTRPLLRLMRSFNPDLVILDLLMQSIDAYAITGRLRRIKSPHHLPVIGLAPSLTHTFPERTAEAGFSACLVKPISPLELRNCVSALLAN